MGWFISMTHLDDSPGRCLPEVSDSTTWRIYLPKRRWIWIVARYIIFDNDKIRCKISFVVLHFMVLHFSQFSIFLVEKVPNWISFWIKNLSQSKGASGKFIYFWGSLDFSMNYSKNDSKCPKLNSSSFSIRNSVYKSVKYYTIDRKRFGVSVINSPSGVSLAGSCPGAAKLFWKYLFI